MHKTNGRRMLGAVKYSCVVVSSNRRVLTASRCGGLRDAYAVGSTICFAHAQASFSTGKSQLCMYQFICSSQQKTDVKKTSSNAST